jgi:hypothetical protein
MKHGHGNDGLAMPASVAHRGLDLFDHRHGGEERGDGHQHHQSPATASDPQGDFAQVVAMAEAHGANTLSATFASALTVENHFAFVNAMAMAAP